ncbi:Monothiol glutaredoxin-S10 [Striga hermonthica]|uniref:Monothiol glutaredoxin-S10 n=1 Tax=Striga hermonthica TaxID=68872 RepID=A0A9N7N4B9_STRHE|nr:Monothiol glutaredoxin-S10 [Striga hermonthica]
MERVVKLASQSPIVIFSKSTCCMCHAITKLFHEHGSSPVVLSRSPPIPAVFIGGKFVGLAQEVLTFHLDGSLRRMLKDSGALWL